MNLWFWIRLFSRLVMLVRLLVGCVSIFSCVSLRLRFWILLFLCIRVLVCLIGICSVRWCGWICVCLM